MLHNHFMVFPMAQLRSAPLADPDDPNLTDGGQHCLFQLHMREVYRRFFDEALDLKLLKAAHAQQSTIPLTDYPQGLPSWEIHGGAEALKDRRFWSEYDLILKGFLDFYSTFFSQVSSRNAPIQPDVHFPDAVENVLLFSNEFLSAAKTIRDQCVKNAKYANAIRWHPAFKQIIYRNDRGKLIVTISQNSIGNAITELLGIVVKREPDADAYAEKEPALIEQLLEVRQRLIASDLGYPIENKR